MFKSFKFISALTQYSSPKRSFSNSSFWRGIENSDGSITLFKQGSDKILTIAPECIKNGCQNRKPAEVIYIRCTPPLLNNASTSLALYKSPNNFTSPKDMVGC